MLSSPNMKLLSSLALLRGRSLPTGKLTVHKEALCLLGIRKLPSHQEAFFLLTSFLLMKKLHFHWRFLLGSSLTTGKLSCIPTRKLISHWKTNLLIWSSVSTSKFSLHRKISFYELSKLPPTEKWWQVNQMWPWEYHVLCFLRFMAKP